MNGCLADLVVRLIVQVFEAKTAASRMAKRDHLFDQVTRNYLHRGPPIPGQFFGLAFGPALSVEPCTQRISEPAQGGSIADPLLFGVLTDFQIHEYITNGHICQRLSSFSRSGFNTSANITRITT